MFGLLERIIKFITKVYQSFYKVNIVLYLSVDFGSDWWSGGGSGSVIGVRRVKKYRK